MTEETQENAHSDEPVEVETTEETTTDSESSDELAKAQKKIIELKKELKGLKKTSDEEKPPVDKPKSDEPDYAKLAFLEGKGIRHSDDQELALKLANRLNLPLHEALKEEYVKSKLLAQKEARKALKGIPTGTGKGKSVTQADVDYWVKKGGTPQDLELANKVIDARMASDKSSQPFDDDLFLGQ